MYFSSVLKLSLPLRLTLSAVLNSVLAGLLDSYLPQYFTLFGGVGAFVIFGSLLTLMNFLVRPLLNLFTFPLHLVTSLLADLLVNTLFLTLIYKITLQMDPNILALTLTGGISGWITIGSVLGVANWALKKIY